MTSTTEIMSVKCNKIFSSSAECVKQVPFTGFVLKGEIFLNKFMESFAL